MRGGSSLTARLLRVAGLLVALGLPAGALAQAPAPTIAGEPANLTLLKREVGQYVDSKRYEADLAKVYGEARAYLAERVAKAAGAKLAIVLDIDETALSNRIWLRANDRSEERRVGKECRL